MSYLAALPDHLPVTASPIPILTFIVPAPEWLQSSNCPFCYIDRRNEAARTLDLSPEDYVAFVEQVAARETIGAICIQGYEPLLARILRLHARDPGGGPAPRTS